MELHFVGIAAQYFFRAKARHSASEHFVDSRGSPHRGLGKSFGVSSNPGPGGTLRHWLMIPAPGKSPP